METFENLTSRLSDSECDDEEPSTFDQKQDIFHSRKRVHDDVYSEQVAKKTHWYNKGHNASPSFVKKQCKSSSSDSDFEESYSKSYNKQNEHTEFRTSKAHENQYSDRAFDQHACNNTQYEGTKDENLTKDYDTSQTSEDHTSAKMSGGLFGGNKAQHMMKIMGYEAGKGLGKCKQGRLEPVEAAKQQGRRGFGLSIPGLEEACGKYDPDEEVIKVTEDMEWLPNDHTDTCTMKELKTWLTFGPKKETIHDETTFCKEETVKNVVNSKMVFDKLDKVEMRRARTRSNPYETIRGAFFLNRAAVKMANMDKACNFMFTKPADLKEDDLLYFADVCAGPGGFSEYVLWRRKTCKAFAKGFGFTLKNENDFKLDDFYAGPCETFHPYYGPKGNGDVFDPTNQNAFRDLIMKHTHGEGVHFMMSDGGFSVRGQENIQEILSKQLYLCQCLVALMIVRTNGHFVTKLFDLFTPFSAGLVYLMYRCFDQVCIFKPNTSRPASSERYLICKGKRGDTSDIMKYLSRVNHLLLKNDRDNDVTSIVSLEELMSEKKLVEYLRNSNDILGQKQITGLLKIAAYCEDTTRIEPSQATMRKKCLEYWEIPDESRTAPSTMKPQDLLRQLLKGPFDSLVSAEPQKLTEVNFEAVLNPPYNWFCIACGSNPSSSEGDELATFYIGMGRTKVFRYERHQWRQITDFKIELPPNTVVYAEHITEMTKDKRNQRRLCALHILDACVLGGKDISKRYIQDRHELIKKFCEVLWKPCPGEYQRVRAKELHPVNSTLHEKLRVIQRPMKNGIIALTYEFPRSPLDDDTDNPNESSYPLYFIPNSVLFLKSTAHPWSRQYSKKYKSTYVFDHSTGLSLYESDRPTKAEASFEESFKSRVVWNWPKDSLHMENVIQVIRKHCPEMDEKR